MQVTITDQMGHGVHSSVEDRHGYEARRLQLWLQLQLYDFRKLKLWLQLQLLQDLMEAFVS